MVHPRCALGTFCRRSRPALLSGQRVRLQLGGTLDLSSIPPVAREFWPSDVCHIDLEGDVQESRLTVAGDSSVSAQIRIRPPQSWEAWLTSRNTWPHLEVELDRWGDIISSPEERLTASLHQEGKQCSVSLAQLTSRLPLVSGRSAHRKSLGHSGRSGSDGARARHVGLFL